MCSLPTRKKKMSHTSTTDADHVQPSFTATHLKTVEEGLGCFTPHTLPGEPVNQMNGNTCTPLKRSLPGNKNKLLNVIKYC